MSEREGGKDATGLEDILRFAPSGLPARLGRRELANSSCLCAQSTSTRARWWMPGGEKERLRRDGGGLHRPRRASPRVLATAGGIVAAAAVTIVLVVVLGTGSQKAPGGSFPKMGSEHWSGALKGASGANALFKGIPQHGLVLGRPSAPVEMELFIDVQCPFCDSYWREALPTIVRKYVRPGEVQIDLEPWAFLGPRSFTGRLGLIAASLQSRGFEWATILFDNQGVELTRWLTSTMMEKIAASVNGINLAEWESARTGAYAASIGHGVSLLARKDHVVGTPTVFVGRIGGKLHDITMPGNGARLKPTELALNTAQAKS